ncbi:hypothetical protein HELRODRAFT_136227, partial [Helobdella robusta]|uniref:RNB domain-containing protein n=1 Tax=Helobdella robusta TaxID=6412 RepID=T1EIC9_HELRO
IFTIDGVTTQDIDDAIGFEDLGNGIILISIHISDVSFYVTDGDSNDLEARKRGTSFYPALGNTIHMLPENLSTDQCSLLPGKLRRALSIFIKVSLDGVIMEDTFSIEKTWIISKYRLTYSEAEQMI